MSDYVDRILKVSAAWREETPSVEALTPDFSTRSYYRLSYPVAGDKPSSVMAMVYDRLISPAAEETIPFASDESFPLVQEVFAKQGIAVPAIYLDRRNHGVLFLEDLGDAMLGSLLLNPSEDRKAVLGYFKDAFLMLAQIKSIEPKVSEKLFARSFSSEILISEMLRFPEFVLAEEVRSASELNRLTACFTWIAAALEQSPWSLSHRDFHAWNLPVDPLGTLRLIDFQDSLIAPDAYDLISLLGDRGTDSLLGKHSFSELLQHYLDLEKKSNKYFQLVDLAAIQRDLRVCGLFHKRKSALLNRGSGEELERVSFWIKTTEHRLGRTLRRILEIHSGSNVLLPLRSVFEGIDNCAAGLEEGPWY